jgi:hypothetical protein
LSIEFRTCAEAGIVGQSETSCAAPAGGSLASTQQDAPAIECQARRQVGRDRALAVAAGSGLVTMMLRVESSDATCWSRERT